jgi:tRNA A-37 threonylcarbamoyl transferase component Bud32
MSNNSLTPIMTRLRMTFLRENGGETNTPTTTANYATKSSSVGLEFSPVSVLLTPDLSVSTEKQKKKKSEKTMTRACDENEIEEDLISPRSPPPVSTLFTSEEPPPLLRPIMHRASFPDEEELKEEDGLTRMNSLNETKLLAVTNLRRQKSNSLPSNFRFDAHFRYERRLGRTANAEVWLVTGLETGEPFVVKKRHKPFTSDLDRRSAMRELEAVANLPEHENVVKVFRGWQQERLFCMQFEYCECGSLGTALQRLRPGVVLEERDIWRLIYEVGSGLKHIHSHSVLHLDLKPENIFIDRQGTFKIGDFGLAWAPGHAWRVEDGDGGYVAPELLNLNADAKPQPSCDIFSFGAMLYELAAGRKFRECKSIEEKDSIPKERSLALRNLVIMCLHRNPNLRPSAVEIVETAIENL